MAFFSAVKLSNESSSVALQKKRNGPKVAVEKRRETHIKIMKRILKLSNSNMVRYHHKSLLRPWSSLLIIMSYHVNPPTPPVLFFGEPSICHSSKLFQSILNLWTKGTQPQHINEVDREMVGIDVDSVATNMARSVQSQTCLLPDSSD